MVLTQTKRLLNHLKPLLCYAMYVKPAKIRSSVQINVSDSGIAPSVILVPENRIGIIIILN